MKYTSFVFMVAENIHKEVAMIKEIIYQVYLNHLIQERKNMGNDSKKGPL